MGSAATVLVVEDEVSLREPLEYLLRLRRYDVVAAGTVAEALAAVRSHSPDAAIIDLRLGAGSGRDVIGALPHGLPVIIFSATARDSGELEVSRPRTRLIEKPCSLTWLINTLDDMLASERPAH